MPKILKLIGKRYGRLTVLSRNEIRNIKGNICWDCICDCGNKTIVASPQLINGTTTTSCGCYNREQVVRALTTHDMSRTKTYHAWVNIIQRCTNKNKKDYKFYGGKGITVCDKWLNSFENFLEDMGSKPPGKSVLKRIQTDGNYEKDNCKWIVRQN